MDLPIVKLNLSLLGFWLHPQKRKIRNFTISFSTEFLKPIFIKSFMAIGLALGILMLLCFPLTLLLILLHPEGMFCLCVPYHSFPPALLLQPMSPSPLLSLSRWNTELLHGVSAPRRCSSASAPTEIAPNRFPPNSILNIPVLLSNWSYYFKNK